jgi:hypothetical protein
MRKNEQMKEEPESNDQQDDVIQQRISASQCKCKQQFSRSSVLNVQQLRVVSSCIFDSSSGFTCGTALPPWSDVTPIPVHLPAFSSSYPLYTQQIVPSPLFDSLPLCIYQVIQLYLKYSDFKQLFFLSHSFKELRKEAIHLKLVNDMSIAFCEQFDFQQRILSQISNKSKQLSLRFCDDIRFSSSVMSQALQTLYEVNISNNSYLSNLALFKKIHTLCLCEIDNLTSCEGLENIIDLKLSRCHQLVDISSLSSMSSLSHLSIRCCYALMDISAVNNVPSLKIDNCICINNLQTLGGEKQQEIFLNNMESLATITDFTFFQNLRKLQLNRCVGEIDLSPFTNLEVLILSSNRRIHPLKCRGYSALYHTKMIDLSNCTLQNTDLSCFANVVSLSLRACSNLTDLSSLGDVISLKKVYLCDLLKVYDYSVLGNVNTLEICRCCFPSMKGLGSVKNVYLVDLKVSSRVLLEGVTSQNRYVKLCNISSNDYSLLKYCYKVALICCNNLQSKDDFVNVRYLYLEKIHLTSSDGVLSLCCNAEMVIIKECAVSKITGLTKVPVVHIIGCWQLQEICDLGENQQVILDWCGTLDISFLSNVPDVRVSRCRIVDFSSFSLFRSLLLCNIRGIPEEKQKELILKYPNISFQEFSSINYEDFFPARS